ncbi:MAG: DUF3786 domain-containing protein [Thermodesulfobacteriota bacterium]
MPPVDPDDISVFRDHSRIPAHYWEELLPLDPLEVCRRTLVTRSAEGEFRIPFLNRIYLCRPEQNRIWRTDDPEKNLSFQEYLVVLMYLLKAQDRPATGKKINEREIPGGELFFRGPHALLKEPLEKRFGRDPEGFLQAGLNLGGRATGKGDASFELSVLPRIPVEYILYRADEEFPAQLVINFDSSIHLHLPLDVIWSMINLTSWRLSVNRP